MSAAAGARPGFATLDQSDIEFFRKTLGAQGVVTDADALKAYNTDWMRKFEGNSRIALRPKTPEEVAVVLAHCNARNLAVRAGNPSSPAAKLEACSGGRFS